MSAVHGAVLKSRKRTLEMYLADNSAPVPQDQKAKKARYNVKQADEYSFLKDLTTQAYANVVKNQPLALTEGGENKGAASNSSKQLATVNKAGASASAPRSTKHVPGLKEQKKSSSALAERFKGTAGALAIKRQMQAPKPEWHAPWVNYRVIAGHVGWVRCVAVDKSNEWFATGAGDRTVKIWDLASGDLKLTLTGHISAVRGIAISDRHPYLFTCGEDKMVKCWDLEQNKVIRHYHGHLSGVYCLNLHPGLDLLTTGGRDSVARVWDMRTKAQIFVLSGHTNTVDTVKSQNADPQIITGSMDSTVKLWDLKAGKCQTTLTNHKKSIRALCLHPQEFTFASASADNIKKWKFPEGRFMQNISGHKAIINALAINHENVFVSGGDNGSLAFWDWKTGHNFFTTQTLVQSGSLSSEAGIFAMEFDQTGSRLITCEADKTIKMWKEDETATPETHPVEWKPERGAVKRF